MYTRQPSNDNCRPATRALFTRLQGLRVRSAPRLGALPTAGEVVSFVCVVRLLADILRTVFYADIAQADDG